MAQEQEFEQKTLKELREYKEAYNAIIDDIENFKTKIEKLEKAIEALKIENANYMEHEDYFAARGTIDDLDAATKEKEELEKKKAELVAEREKRDQNAEAASNAEKMKKDRIGELKNRAREITQDMNDLKYNHEKYGYTNEQYNKLFTQRQNQINEINEEIAMLLGVKKPEKEPEKETEKESEYKPGTLAEHIEKTDKENKEKLAEAKGAVIEEAFTKEDAEAAGIDVDKATEEVKAEDSVIDIGHLAEDDGKGRKTVEGIASKGDKASKLLDKIKKNKGKLIAGVLSAVALVGLAIVGGPVITAALEGGSLGTLATLGITGYAGSKSGVLKK